jgi:CBS domain-containing protein
MKLQQVMTRDAETISSDATVWAAAKLLRDLNIGFLPVCDQGRLVGVLTDRDIVVRAVAEGRDPVLTSVQEVMTPEVITCFADQSAEEAAQIMLERQIRRVLILDQDKKLVGVVSLGDLAVDALNQEQAGRTLQNISWPAQPRRPER